MLLFFCISFYALYLSYLELTTPLYCLDDINEIRSTIEFFQNECLAYKEEVDLLERALSDASPDQRSNLLKEL